MPLERLVGPDQRVVFSSVQVLDRKDLGKALVGVAIGVLGPRWECEVSLMETGRQIKPANQKSKIKSQK
jgi:hypothetical protein